jgi:5-(carboxyamino)imidazole ribonucleotide synthase
MINIVGRAPAAAQVLAVDGAHLHMYGKKERARRKIGHITVTRDSKVGVQHAVGELLGLVDAANEPVTA